MASKGKSALQQIWSELYPHESLEQVNLRIDQAKQRVLPKEEIELEEVWELASPQFPQSIVNLRNAFKKNYRTTTPLPAPTPPRSRFFSNGSPIEVPNSVKNMADVKPSPLRAAGDAGPSQTTASLTSLVSDGKSREFVPGVSDHVATSLSLASPPLSKVPNSLPDDGVTITANHGEPSHARDNSLATANVHTVGDKLKNAGSTLEDVSSKLEARNKRQLNVNTRAANYKNWPNSHREKKATAPKSEVDPNQAARQDVKGKDFFREPPPGQENTHQVRREQQAEAEKNYSYPGPEDDPFVTANSSNSAGEGASGSVPPYVCPHPYIAMKLADPEAADELAKSAAAAADNYLAGNIPQDPIDGSNGNSQHAGNSYTYPAAGSVTAQPPVSYLNDMVHPDKSYSYPAPPNDVMYHADNNKVYNYPAASHDVRYYADNKVYSYPAASSNVKSSADNKVYNYPAADNTSAAAAGTVVNPSSVHGAPLYYGTEAANASTNGHMVPYPPPHWRTHTPAIPHGYMFPVPLNAAEMAIPVHPSLHGVKSFSNMSQRTKEVDKSPTPRPAMEVDNDADIGSRMFSDVPHPLYGPAHSSLYSSSHPANYHPVNQMNQYPAPSMGNYQPGNQVHQYPQGTVANYQVPQQQFLAPPPMFPPHLNAPQMYAYSPYMTNSPAWTMPPGSGTFPQMPGYDNNYGPPQGMVGGHASNQYDMNAGNQPPHPVSAGLPNTRQPPNRRLFTRRNSSGAIRDVKKPQSSALVADPNHTDPLPPSAFQYYVKRTVDGKAVMPRWAIKPSGKYAGVLVMSGGGYQIRANEVVSFLGRASRVLEIPEHSSIYAVCILQDRMSGKTNEVFAEVVEYRDAYKTVTRHSEMARSHNKMPKIGHRVVQLSVSSIDVLLKKLFPKAACGWDRGRPVRDDAYLSKHPLPWIGFISTEELRSVLIQCQNPEKLMQGRYNGSNPERVYQMMMSSVQKIPWFMPEDHWFPKAWVTEFKKTLHQMAVLLAFKVRNRTNIALDVKLLDSFMLTLHACPMFCADDAKMKDYNQIADQVDLVTHGPLLTILPGFDFSYLNGVDENLDAETKDAVH